MSGGLGHRSWLAAGLMLVLLPAFAAMTELRAFDLQHRSAEELVPVLRPLVDAEGAISGTGNTLLVRASLQNLAELEAAIASLDQPRRQLVISVRQGGNERTVRRGGSLSGRIGDDDLDIAVGAADRHSSVRIYSSDSGRGERIAQRLQVSEGGWARIQAGEAVPVPQQSVTIGPGGSRVQHSIEYRDVQSGFEVRPHLTGDGRVTLDVRPFRARRSPEGGGVIEQQEILTTISGPIGEWLAIGGGIDTRQDNRRGTVYSTKTREHSARRVFVRVDIVER